MKNGQKWLVVLMTVVLILSVVACAKPTPVRETVVVEKIVTAVPAGPQKVKVHGIFATKLTEPWDQAIHRALVKLADQGLIDYQFSEDLGYSGKVETEMRKAINDRKPDLTIGDGFGNEEAVRKVAAENPKIAFAFGSAGGPSLPNFSVFDNWNHDGSFIAGQIAGKISKSGVIGMVLGVDCGEVNRLAWAFIKGAQSVNPKVTVLASYIAGWYDPAKAEEHAAAKIEAGANVIYCERVGAEQAAVKAKKKVYVIGQMVDQYQLAPENTVTSVVWDMTTTVESAVKSVAAGTFTGQDLGPMSYMASGGTYMAPIQDNIERQLPGIRAFMEEQIKEVMGGRRTPVIEDSVPPRVKGE